MLENKNIGKSHLEDLTQINSKYQPNNIDFIIVELDHIEEKAVAEFKYKDWKKHTKKLLKLNDEEFDTSGILETNFITSLNNADFFVDVAFDDSDNNNMKQKVEVYKKGKSFRKFVLSDWTKHLDLIEVGSDKIKDYNYNSYIAELYSKMFSKKIMISIDRQSMKPELEEKYKIYSDKTSNLNKKFVENFSTTYNITQSIAEELYFMARKYVYENGMFPQYEEFMIDVYNYKHS